MDAWGKLPSGILYGNLFDLGNFDECLSARTFQNLADTITSTEIKGKYCLVQISVENKNLQFLENEKKEVISDEFKPKIPTVFDLVEDRTSFNLGTCFPHICNEDDILDYLKNMIASIKLPINVPTIPYELFVRYCSKDESEPFTTPFYIALYKLVFLFQLPFK